VSRTWGAEPSLLEIIQMTPHMRILVTAEPLDFRKGIDSLAEPCRAKRRTDLFSGSVLVFRSRR
jgi:transposase